jgi:hypothetical protein
MLRPTVQSASLSWHKAPIWVLRPDLYYCQTVAGLLMWALSLTRERVCRLPDAHMPPGCLLYNYFAWITQKTQHLCCCEGVFTEPLRSNGSYLIVACVFVAEGICLPSRYLAMNVYSDFGFGASCYNILVRVPPLCCSFTTSCCSRQ